MNCCPSIAKPAARDGCDVFSKTEIALAPSHATSLLTELPDGSKIVLCKKSGADGSLFVLGPITERDNVSFYSSEYFRIEEEFIKKLDLEELSFEEPATKNIMMAHAKSEGLSHFSDAFIETQFITIGTFKYIYTRWSSAINNSKQISKLVDVSILSENDLVQYELFKKSILAGKEWVIASIVFADIYIADSYPRLIIEFANGNQIFEIAFDITASGKLILLDVNQALHQ